MNCPICKNAVAVESLICDNCSFELMVMPENSSDEFKRYYQGRVDRHRLLFDNLNNKISENNSLTQDFAKTKKDLEEFIQKYKSLEDELKTFEGKVSTSKEEIDRLKSFEILFKAKIEELNISQAENEKLKGIISKIKEEKQNLMQFKSDAIDKIKEIDKLKVIISTLNNKLKKTENYDNLLKLAKILALRLKNVSDATFEDFIKMLPDADLKRVVNNLNIK